MSEKRKKALVLYMAGLFGVAFLIVSISLGIQIKKKNPQYHLSGKGGCPAE